MPASPPLTVALVAPANALHTVRWANALSERDYMVHLFSIHATHAQLAPAVYCQRLPFRSPHGYFLAAGALRRGLRRLAPDVVNAHYASGYGTLVRRVGEGPLALSVWGSDVFEFPHRSRWHQRLLVKNLRAADQVLSTSHAMAAAVEELTPLATPPTVTPFGVDTARFRPARTPRANGQLVIGTVKTLAPAYGIDRLIRAFARTHDRLHQSAPELAERLTLRIGGDGPDREALERLCQELGIAERVTFSGRIAHADVPAYLADLDAFVALSRRESFGVAVLEASACGLPVVVSDAGGLPEVVADGCTGIVVPGGEPIAAGETLSGLMHDHERRHRMGADGRRWVVQHYEWQQSVDTMEAAYGALAAGASRSGAATT